MVHRDEQGRPEPPEAGDELATLLGFLEFQRATFAWKCTGVDAAALRTTIGVSTMTLGGLLKHMALVETCWFSERLHGRDDIEPWASVDWDARPDWEWETARADSPDELLALWSAAVERSRVDIALALDADGLDAMTKAPDRRGAHFSLRWIFVHMIEEYARHNGHADLLREAVDGETGE